jgi:hypothetical protein
MARITQRAALIVALAIVSLALIAACDDETTQNGEPTSNGETPVPEGTFVFEGGREPIERTFPQGIQAPILLGARATEQDHQDRLLLEFEDGAPDYRAEYVDTPTDCASGEPVEIQGTAFLQIRFSPATAHLPDGTPSTFQQLNIAGPSMIEAKQTCDFEGVVTWVVGLTEEVDFRIGASFTDIFIYQLLIDAVHP